MKKPTLTHILIAGGGIGALGILGVALFVHDDGAAREARLRDRAEFEKKFATAGSPPDAPEATFKALRRSFALGAAPSDLAARAARADVLKHGDASIPYLRVAIRDTSELPRFRTELIGILGEMKTPIAEAELLGILNNRGMEDCYRITALGGMGSRSSDAAFASLRRIFDEEPAFRGRALAVKVLGASERPECTPLLISAVRNDADPSVRILAVDALGKWIDTPNCLTTLKETLMQDREENVRLACLGAIGRSTDPSIDLLLQQIVDQSALSPPLRKAAESWIERRKSRP